MSIVGERRELMAQGLATCLDKILIVGWNVNEDLSFKNTTKKNSKLKF